MTSHPSHCCHGNNLYEYLLSSPTPCASLPAHSTVLCPPGPTACPPSPSSPSLHPPKTPASSAAPPCSTHRLDSKTPGLPEQRQHFSAPSTMAVVPQCDSTQPNPLQLMRPVAECPTEYLQCTYLPAPYCASTPQCTCLMPLCILNPPGCTCPLSDSPARVPCCTCSPVSWPLTTSQRTCSEMNSPQLISTSPNCPVHSQWTCLQFSSPAIRPHDTHHGLTCPMHVPQSACSQSQYPMHLVQCTCSLPNQLANLPSSTYEVQAKDSCALPCTPSQPNYPTMQQATLSEGAQAASATAPISQSPCQPFALPCTVYNAFGQMSQPPPPPSACPPRDGNGCGLAGVPAALCGDSSVQDKARSKTLKSQQQSAFAGKPSVSCFASDCTKPAHTFRGGWFVSDVDCYRFNGMQDLR